MTRITEDLSYSGTTFNSIDGMANAQGGVLAFFGDERAFFGHEVAFALLPPGTASLRATASNENGRWL